MILFVAFSYAMDGLSADKMKVLLHPQDNNKLTEDETHSDDKHLIDGVKGEINEQRHSEFLSFKDSIVLTTLQDNTRGKWKKAQAGFLALRDTFVITQLPKILSRSQANT